ncbi:hypothetical protein CEXT_29301 [Caerostris extrusa]|uniref:Uncharacterized protein n=1 Tax=Caerostris extrusa TaxID=172846 RepID=A0AAV4Y408_CAEEX|nr:hypothetical protein CEXT_29301 [Caerostris extrusa]
MFFSLLSDLIVNNSLHLCSYLCKVLVNILPQFIGQSESARLQRRSSTFCNSAPRGLGSLISCQQPGYSGIYHSMEGSPNGPVDAPPGVNQSGLLSLTWNAR